jgi:hypothetical protein
METETKTTVQSNCCQVNVIPCWDSSIDENNPVKYICTACHRDCKPAENKIFLCPVG